MPQSARAEFIQDGATTTYYSLRIKSKGPDTEQGGLASVPEGAGDENSCPNATLDSPMTPLAVSRTQAVVTPREEEPVVSNSLQEGGSSADVSQHGPLTIGCDTSPLRHHSQPLPDIADLETKLEAAVDDWRRTARERDNLSVRVEELVEENAELREYDFLLPPNSVRTGSANV